MGALRKGGRDLVVVAVIVAVLAGLALTRAAGSAPDPGTARVAIASQHFGFSASLPQGWKRAPKRLVPLLMPREVLSVGTAPMPPGGGGNCGREPVAALARMRPGDALVSIQEYAVTRRMRARLRLGETYPLLSSYSSADRLGLRRYASVHLNSEPGPRFWSATLSFRDGGRVFDALVYLGDRRRVSACGRSSRSSVASTSGRAATWAAPHRVSGMARVSLFFGTVAFLAGVLATGSSGAPPRDTSPCTRSQTHAAFNAFFTDFNQGRFARLDALFADEPAFQWYSSPAPGRRLNRAAMQRRTLIPYFRRRHERHEEFRLLAFNFVGNSGHWSNFWFEGLRSADGFNDGHWRGMTGKGAAICDQGTAQFIVLSLGRHRAELQTFRLTVHPPFQGSSFACRASPPSLC